MPTVTAPTPLSLGSMCTGYGGLDMAVSAVLDVAPAWVADPDPGAAAILAHHWPHVPNLGDISALAALLTRPTADRPTPKEETAA